MWNIPVRKAAAVKSSTRVISDIRSLLFHYAFARSTTRFQLKVLKTESSFKGNWTFIPSRSTDSLVLTAAKIVGKDQASQFQIVNYASERDHYSLSALMLKPDAGTCHLSRDRPIRLTKTDLLKCSHSDVYVSVDGRPLRAERGVFKDIHKIYASYLQNHLCKSSQQAISQFLLIHLKCPADSTLR